MRPPPALCAGGIGPRGRSAGTPRAAVHAGHRPPAGVPRALRRPPYTRGIGPRRRSATHAGRRTRRASAPRGHSAGLPQAAATRGASALAGVPQASRRPPPTRGLGPRGRSAGLPPCAAARGAAASRGHSATHAARRTSRGLGHPRAFRDPCSPSPHTGPQPSQAFPTPPAARARPHPPAARFSRKPPCGIGSRMVYCT